MSPLKQEWFRAMRGGDYRRAWMISERLNAHRDPATPDDPAMPYHRRWVWDSSDVAGRNVLVRCYHGLGDTIQFLRYLPELRRRATSVTLEIQPRLRPLLSSASWADRVVDFDPAKPLPPADCDVEIMELSFALKIAPAAVPPPYLSVEATPLPLGMVGLCCKAGDWDPDRSISPEIMMAICKHRDCIALDPEPSPLAVLNPAGCAFDIVETARLVAGLSLVITVDTMIAHLAGAMNKPAWLLLKHEPDWRWPLQDGRSDWYPSMRLYTQSRPGDWTGVMQRVEADLDRSTRIRRSDGE
jgi:hypothetical protein